MIEIGTKIRVFKEKGDDSYHKQGFYKKGTVVGRYPNFYLVAFDEGKSRECFYESEMEIIKDDNDREPRENSDI